MRSDLGPEQLTHHATPGGRVWRRPMRGRDGEQSHRAATPLELFFDLCFVVAVAVAAERLHHAVAENHAGEGLVGFAMVFFTIWWAWMNFTWFASAYDTDDGLYRVTTLVQMAGVLTLAAGIPRAFDDGDFTVIWFGFLIMRLAMVTHWLRAARDDRERRPCALRYAIGIAACQIGWVAILVVPGALLPPVFAALALCELAVPAWAERAGPTTWHPVHIAERYGLFTIIVLGETILAATTALREATESGHGGATLISLAIAGLVIVFSLWWLYFSVPSHNLLTSLRTTFLWGYGHFVILASAAAVGAGFAVAVDHDAGKAALSGPATAWASAVPIVLYLLSVWVLQIRVCVEVHGLTFTLAFPVTAGLVLLTPLGPAPLHVMAGLVAALVAVSVLTGRRHAAADLVRSRP